MVKLGHEINSKGDVEMNNGTALIIIDMQVDLLSGPIYKGDELLKNIALLIEKARLANKPIIYIQHTEQDDESMGKNREGWRIHPLIEPDEEDIVVLKYTPDSFHETRLHEELSSRNIKNIVIAGLQTEYCVDTTCRSAFRLGYNTTLVRDGHSTYDSRIITAAQIIEHHNKVLGSWFAKLKTADEIVF